MMRGYRALKESGQIERIATVKQALTNYSLGLPVGGFSSLVMGSAIDSSELVIRQYLLLRVGGNSLNHAILLAVGKEAGRVVLPIPKEWRQILTKHGFEVAHLRCVLLWWGYIFILLLIGISKIGKTIIVGVATKNPRYPIQKRYVYFCDLGLGNLPTVINNIQSHDIVSWYLKWSGRKPDIEAVRHSVAFASKNSVGNIAVEMQPRPLPPIKGKSLALYFFWGFRAITTSLFDCLRGRWWHAILLYEAALAAQARFVPQKLLACEYLFHNSGYIYRPLWTYETEMRGSTISFYFYSTNCEAFKRSGENSAIPYGWSAMNWPQYMVWDEYQADFVRRAVGMEANIITVGQIWFQSSNVKIRSLDKPVVAVFDVTPHRPSLYCTYGIAIEYYTPIVALPFLDDVKNVTQRLNAFMLWKRKRNIGRNAHPKYRYFSDQLAENKHVVIVEPEISANRIIENCVAVISMPFTSTAIIAREMGKPSIYYDPSGILQLDDRASHGIPILFTVVDLEAWLSAHLATKDS